jgi:hypothetical protein
MEEKIEHTQEYEKPVVIDYGDLRELTAANSLGNHTDRDFPRSTPPTSITFSFT